MALEWRASDSADDTHPDMETDLTAIGSPGGASWAYVALEGEQWAWGVLDHWLWDNAETLAEGVAATKDGALGAVANWVREHTPGGVS